MSVISYNGEGAGNLVTAIFKQKLVEQIEDTCKQSSGWQPYRV